MNDWLKDFPECLYAAEVKKLLGREKFYLPVTEQNGVKINVCVCLCVSVYSYQNSIRES